MWKKKDEALLAKLWALDIPARTIAKRVAKSEGAIYSKARRLKLSSRQAPARVELGCVICGAPSSGRKYCSPEHRKPVRAVTATCIKCGVQFTHPTKVQRCLACRVRKPKAEPKRRGEWLQRTPVEALALHCFRYGARSAARKFGLGANQVTGWWYKHGKHFPLPPKSPMLMNH